MSGSSPAGHPSPEAAATRTAAKPAPANPDSLEVAPGTAHARVEGWIPELATAEDLFAALEQAFDYRGDVTITRKNGTKMEGYLFDRRKGATLQESFMRLWQKDSGGKVSVSYADVAGLAFSGRDTAAGRSWEAWVRKYWEKKAAGEQGIGLQPDSLDA